MSGPKTRATACRRNCIVGASSPFIFGELALDDTEIAHLLRRLETLVRCGLLEAHEVHRLPMPHQASVVGERQLPLLRVAADAVIVERDDARPGGTRLADG